MCLPNKIRSSWINREARPVLEELLKVKEISWIIFEEGYLKGVRKIFAFIFKE